MNKIIPPILEQERRAVIFLRPGLSLPWREGVTDRRLHALMMAASVCLFNLICFSYQMIDTPVNGVYVLSLESGP